MPRPLKNSQSRPTIFWQVDIIIIINTIIIRRSSIGKGLKTRNVMCVCALFTLVVDSTSSAIILNWNKISKFEFPHSLCIRLAWALAAAFVGTVTLQLFDVYPFTWLSSKQQMANSTLTEDRGQIHETFIQKRSRNKAHPFLPDKMWPTVCRLYNVDI